MNINYLRKPCETFDISVLPGVLRSFVEEKMKPAMEPIFLVQSLICSLSAMVGKRRYIQKGEYYQRLYPNIWAISISPSGTFKTTALNRGASFALEHHHKINKELVEKVRLLKKASDKHEVREIKDEIEKLEGEGVLLPTRGSTQGLTDSLENSNGGQVMTSDLGAWIKNFSATYNGGYKTILTDIYGVPEFMPIERTRSGRVTKILKRPFVTINAVSTITWIEENIVKGDVESEFFARFLLFYPPQSHKKSTAIPPKKIINFSAENQIMRILDDIRCEKPLAYKISSDGVTYLEKIYSALFDQMQSLDETSKDLLFPYINRWIPSILKIGILFQPFIDKKSDKVEIEAIHAALQVVEYAIKSTIHLFRRELGESKEQRETRKVLEFIAKHGGAVKRQKLIASKTLDGHSDHYDRVLCTLIDAGKISVDDQKEKKPNWIYTLLDGID